MVLLLIYCIPVYSPVRGLYPVLLGVGGSRAIRLAQVSMLLKSTVVVSTARRRFTLILVILRMTFSPDIERGEMGSLADFALLAVAGSDSKAWM